MQHKNSTLPILLLALLAALLISGSVLAGDKNLIFEIQDPRGDDHGNGLISYPIRSDYERGDLDIVRFAARRVAGGTQFEATFARPVKVPDRQAIDDLGTTLESVARNGFYTMNIDIYIDRDREAGSGAISLLPGRNAEVDPAHAWDRAIVLTPRPLEARAALREMMMKSLNERLRGGDYQSEEFTDALRMRDRLPVTIENRVFFPQQVRVRGQKISFLVPDGFLGGLAQADWSYTVVISGADLVQSFDLAATYGLSGSTADSLMILPVSPGRWQDRFGGGREDEPLQPPIIDTIVPPTEIQERLLANFDSRSELMAKLVGVVPAELAAPASSSKDRPDEPKAAAAGR